MIFPKHKKFYSRKIKSSCKTKHPKMNFNDVDFNLKWLDEYKRFKLVSNIGYFKLIKIKFTKIEFV